MFAKYMETVMKLKTIIIFCIISCISLYSQANKNIIFLGDENKIHLLNKCQTSNQCKPYTKQQILVAPNNTSAVETANLAYTAKHGILVVDAKSGPLRITRDDILIARQTKIPELSVFFLDTHVLFDILGEKEGQELLDMQVEEIKQLLASYEMDTLTPKYYFSNHDLKKLIRYSSTLTIRENYTKNMKPATVIKSFIYNLSEAEMGKDLKKNTTVTVWIAGQSTQAKIISNKDIQTGETADITLILDQPIKLEVGERFFIEINQRFNSAGVISSIIK